MLEIKYYRKKAKVIDVKRFKDAEEFGEWYDRQIEIEDITILFIKTIRNKKED